MDEQSIFLNALEEETAEARSAWLDQACGTDLPLKARIEALIASQLEVSGLLERPSAEFEVTVVPNVREADRCAALEGGLAATFTAGEAVVIGAARHSVFKSLGQSVNYPRVALRESGETGTDPIVRPQSAEMPQKDADSRYQLQGEIARGGMGAILKGRDTDLGRDLAIKVLLDSHKNKPEVVQRFIEEAQIGGQLQHPGIAPVYELGQFADRRPFFSMKLVKGETFSKILSARKDPAEDRGRFLAIFEQVCQTMAYAHSRGVIHRDLKPANIMVGAFGEVQVMDWGLAKVLPTGGVSDERKAHSLSSDHSVIQTLRSKAGGTTPELFGSHTQVGSVMGTPAYMPPEQALGEIDQLDERADVFGLAAILCEILTGRPPYVGDDGTQVFRLAVRGKLEPCFERLSVCGADAELIALTTQCLELEPKARPRDAGVLVKRITAYLTSVEARLRAVEIDRAAEAARAEEALLTAKEHRLAATAERRARRLQLGLAIVVLCMLTAGGMAAAWTAIVQSHLRQNAETAEHAATSARDAESRQLARAEQEKARAESEQKRAETEKQRSDNMLTDMQTERGLRAGSEGQFASAAMWFTHSAKVTPHDRTRQQANLLRAQSWMKQAMLPVARLTTPDGNATRLVFQPHGPLLLTIQDRKFRVWDWRNELTLSWSDALNEVNDAAWSPDGRQVAVASGSAGVRLLESSSGNELAHFHPNESVAVIRWSPNGKRLVLGARNTQIWNLEGAPRKESEFPHPGNVYALNFNRAGTQLVTACEDNLARVFAVGNLATNEPLRPPFEHAPITPSIISAPVFCDADRHLVTIIKQWSGPGLWNLAAEKNAVRRWEIAPDFNRSIDVSPDGRWVAAAGGQNCALVCVDGTTLTLPHRNHLHQAIFHPTGNSLVTLGYEGIARVWPLDQVSSKHLPVTSIIPQLDTYASGWYSLDGTALAIVSNRQVVVWEQVEESTIAGRMNWTEGYMRARISFDGQLVTPAVLHAISFDHTANGGNLSVASMADGQPAGPTIPLAGLLYESCVCSDNRSVAAATVQGSTGILSVFDIATGRPIFPAVQLPDLPASVDVHPQRPQLAVLCRNGQLLLIDTRTGQIQHTLNHDGQGAERIWARVVYSPDGEALVSVTSNSLVFVRESESGKLRFPALNPVVQDGPCRAMTISRDGRLLATGVCGKNVTQVWDLRTGQKLGREMPHGGSFYGLWSVEFSPDGDKLLTGHTDGRARIWDWRTGQIIGIPMQHPDEVFHATFTPDGRHVLASPRNCTLHIWDVASGKLAVAPIPKLVPAKVDTTYVSIFGNRAAVSELGRYSILDLAELLKSPAEDVSSTMNRLELASNLHVQVGEQMPLDRDQWNTRWEAYARTRQDPNQTAALLAKALDQVQFEPQRRVIIARALRLNLFDQLVQLRPNHAGLQRVYIAEMSMRGRNTKSLVTAAIAAVSSAVRSAPDDQGLQKDLAELRTLELPPTKWTPLDPLKVNANSDCTFTKQPDGSILASAKLVPFDQYTIVSSSSLQRIAALRLEAIPHPVLPKNGSGLDPEGNFCLSKATLSVKHVDGQNSPLQFRLAASDYTRIVDAHTRPGDGPWAVYDNLTTTRWDVYPKVAEPHWLILELETPYEMQAGDELIVKLQFATECMNARLGCFRLSVSEESRAAAMQILVRGIQDNHFKASESLTALELIQGNAAAIVAHLGSSDRMASLTLNEELLLAQAYSQQGKTDEAHLVGKRLLDRKVDPLPTRELLALYIDAVTRNGGLTLAELHDRLTDESLETRFVRFEHSGRWSDAAAVALQILDQRPTSRICFTRAAAVLGMSSDTDGYRKLCTRLVDQFANTINYEEADTVCKINLLLPDSMHRDRMPVKLLRDSLEQKLPASFPPWGWACLGLVAYRDGNFQEATNYCQKSRAVSTLEGPVGALALAIESMARHQLKEASAAGDALAKAVAIIQANRQARLDAAQIGRQLGEIDPDYLIAEILCKEAKHLIEGSAK
jgi:WD40 repeat protein/tRNA A-37 threonylcarbamoyl transferase component Bud32/tetratricopeptide (TPR) repeat protein